jgi:hypothetical protein
MASLASDRADQVEVGVIVEYSQVELLGRGRYQQGGYLPATLASFCKQSLHLECPVYVQCRRLDGIERGEGGDEPIPLISVPSGVSDL